MDKDNMFGTPCKRPPGTTVLRKVWVYVIKHHGKSNSRNTCDGSTLTGKGIKYVKNYEARASKNGPTFFFPCLKIWDT